MAIIHKSEKEKKPDPYVSIGCGQVIWGSKELDLVASTNNINEPVFSWVIDGIVSGNSSRLKKEFDIGSHEVVVNVSSGNYMLSADKQIISIDSIDGVSLRNFQVSTDQWGFQTTYKGRDINVQDVMISVDSQPAATVPACSPLVSDALRAGAHTWEASYRNEILGRGVFNLKEAYELKITEVDIAPVYRAGDTVNAKIVLENKGTETISGFDTTTLVVNNNYAWMGDRAKREFHDSYYPQLEPGARYEIPVVVKIPESVNGVRPSGLYTIKITVLLRNQMVADTRSFNMQVT
jgi:hypothetical protein